MIEFPVKRMLTTMNAVPKPVLAMSILAYPLIDTLRVFILRASKGRSPFSADKNHIHHKLLSLGLSHRQTSLFCAVWLLRFYDTSYLPFSALFAQHHLFDCDVCGCWQLEFCFLV
jgi:hypothetical protein